MNDLQTIQAINDSLKDDFKTISNREPNKQEMDNLGNDALMLARYLLKKVQDLENRIIKLEKK